MKRMLPHPSTMEQLYNRLYSDGKKVKKQILVDALKLAHYWYDYVRQRQYKYKQEIADFESKLKAGTLTD